MRPFKVMATVLMATLLVTSLCVSVAVMAAPLDVARSSPTTDSPPMFTRFLTVTVEPGEPLSDSLASVWQEAIIGFPVPDGGFETTRDLPPDATAITASVRNGEFSITGTNIVFSLSAGLVADLGWSYRTGQKVVRTGNQYKIDQFAGNNNFYRYVGTILFPAPYQYVGSINFSPKSVTTDTLHWDLIVPQNSPPNHVFNASSWLVDPRLGQPDLTFTAASMTIESLLNPPIAYLTATVRNHNAYLTSTASNHNAYLTSTASNLAFLEFYDRASPSAPPGGPRDHAGGWCGTDTVPVCPALDTFINPIPSLAPGDSVTVVMTYPLQLPGLRDYYFQIDTFGEANGLNVEFDETNNVYTLARDITIDYLASIAISGPLTGPIQNPLVFDAQVSPSLAVSRPLTYTWSPSPDSGQSTARATYTWFTAELQAITVTAYNANQIIVTGTHTLSIVEVPLTGANITGPITVSQNISHAYFVSAQPVTATLPLTYVWDPEPDQGQATAVATYTLTDLGERTLTAIVSNLSGPALIITHTVTSVPPLAAVTIEGPATGRVGTTYTFTATVDPADAAPPLSYQWSPSPDSGQGEPQAAYLWTTDGAQAISVTVRNDSGPVTGTRAISIAVPLTSATITGPITVSQNISHAYRVSAQPVTATLPLIYVWDPPPGEGQATAVATYTLASLGKQTLTVTVSNLISPVVTATQVVVSVPPLAAVAIEGPATGRVGTTYTFTATVNPANAAPPLSYQWSPSPDSGQGAPQAAYHWTTDGAQAISVTVRNDSGPVTGTRAISIAVPLTSASITGPITVSQNISHAYYVSAQPVTATLPLIYVWDPPPAQGQATAVATYTLASLGKQTLTVTVTNLIGPVVTATQVVVSVPPLTAVTIEGPATGRVGTTYTFTATVNPANAAPPLSYQWSPSPASGQGAPQAAYHWLASGAQVISVTAHNDSGEVATQHRIITGGTLYLPLIRK